MKNKKSQFFMLFVVLIAIATLIGGLIIINLKIPGDDQIGSKQIKLIQTYQETEKALFYIDQSAKYSAEEAIVELAKSGAGSNCEDYFGYALWVDIDDGKIKECYPKKEQVTEKFKEEFQTKLDNYLINYNTNPSLTLPLNNYVLEISDKKIIGKSKNSLVVIIGDDSTFKQQESLEEEQSDFEKEGTKVTSTAISTYNLVDIKEVPCSGTCKLTSEAYEALKKANEEAKKEGFEIYVYSSYRSREYQIKLWEGETPENYKEKYPDEAERRKYVCFPYGEDVFTRCPHLTGGAVDVRVKGKTKSQMTSYGWQILAEIMYKAGWVRYTNENWHFEYKTDRWTRAQEARVNEIV